MRLFGVQILALPGARLRIKSYFGWNIRDELQLFGHVGEQQNSISPTVI